MRRNHNNKNLAHDITVFGIPESLPKTKLVSYRSRLATYVNNMMNEFDLDNVEILITTNPESRYSDSKLAQKVSQKRDGRDDEITLEERAQQYKSQSPLFDFDFLVVPDHVMENLMLAVSLIELEPKVFDQWGLRRIEPFPRTALNFYGEPGTGKTLAAHAIASYLNFPIMIASYAQIESKFHGEGPKNVEALFYAAERDRAVLFIDEADSLLSKRLTNVSQGSEQAINSMRSQLLISLEKFKGVVIFATNLVENYDKAFETRVRSIHFPMPDEKARLEIWRRHLGDGTKPPLSTDVNPYELAKIEDICGRDIKNALIDAALHAAQIRDVIEQADLMTAVERVKASRIEREDEMKGEVADEETSQKILDALESESTQ